MAEQEKTVNLIHGSGGRSYHQLIEEVFLPAFDNHFLREMNDSAVCPLHNDRIALTTDSFVVKPRFFPGGDIGRLAVCGTVNDLSMSGARALYLTCAMIIEAGFPITELRMICQSMAEAAKEAGIRIVTGDTKVVEKGSCDGIFINTAGVGMFSTDRPPLCQKIQCGDVLLLSGTMGDHGMAVMAAREQFTFSPPLQSDVAPLNGIVEQLLRAAPHTHALRDATRGGVAAVCNEWADAAALDIVLQEEKLPIRPEIHAACELLGLDPLYVANEGKFVASVPVEEAKDALSALRAHPLGKDAAIIGSVEGSGGKVSLATPWSTLRLVEMPDGEQLPRIC